MEKALKTNHKQMFREDILTQLRTWRSKEDRAILMMDVNENMVDGAMCKHFGKDDLNMKGVEYSQTHMMGSKTYSKGQVAIDGSWLSEELEISTAAWLSFKPALVDHQPVVVNISKKYLLDMNCPKIKPSAARQLNSKVKQIQQKYIDKLEEGFRKHLVLERMTNLREETDKGLSTEASEVLGRLDSHITELMTCVKKQRRML